MNATRIPRLAALDGLRGIAALMVFVHHVQLPGLHPQLIGMDAGVLVFFALSGYLLYAPFVLARERWSSIDLRSYAVRRILRIFPAYLVASMGIGALFDPGSLRDPVGILTMSRTPVIVAWTLQLELLFYALLPVLAWLVTVQPSMRRLRVLALIGSVSIAPTLAVLIATPTVTGSVIWSDFVTIGSFLWAFIPGMLVAELQHRDRLRRAASAWVPIAGAGLIALSVVFDLPANLDVAANIGAALMIAHIVTRPDLPAVLAGAAAAAGAVSYSFYLWHEALIPAVDRPATWLGAATALALSIFVAAVVYLFVERPCIALSRRLTHAPHGQGRIRPDPSLVAGG